MTTKQDDMTAAFQRAAAQRASANAARTRADLDALRTPPPDNPSAAVGFVALVVLIVIGAGGITAFMWFFSMVTR